jgi:hypothetical protein
MPPLTLTILASVLKLHGPDATISNDHKCNDLLLGEGRGQLGEQDNPPLPRPGAKGERFVVVVNEDDKATVKADDDLKSVKDHKKSMDPPANPPPAGQSTRNRREIPRKSK